MITVPPVGVIAERQVAAHFRRYGAVSPAKPMGYAPVRWTHARALSRLRDHGIVKGGPGALYLDEAAWATHRKKQRKRALALLAIGIVSAGIAGITTFRG